MAGIQESVSYPDVNILKHTAKQLLELQLESVIENL